MFLGEYLASSEWVEAGWMTILFALVTGNFLHISTTIFLESSPSHKLDATKLLVIFIGSALALVTEIFG